MSVNINESGSDNATPCVNHDITSQVVPNSNDAIAVDDDIGEISRCPRSIDEQTVGDESCFTHVFSVAQVGWRNPFCPSVFGVDIDCQLVLISNIGVKAHWARVIAKPKT